MKKKENFEQLQLLQSSIFFAETLHTFPTYQCLQMGVSDFFYLFRSCVTCKNKKRPGFYTLVFDIFLKNSRSKQSKQIPNNLVGSVCKVSAENVKLCGSSACQSFQFFRQIAQLFKNNRALSKFRYQILYKQISI